MRRSLAIRPLATRCCLVASIAAALAGCGVFRPLAGLEDALSASLAETLAIGHWEPAPESDPFALHDFGRNPTGWRWRFTADGDQSHEAAGESQLEALAGREGAAGVNATILLARRAPDRASLNEPLRRVVVGTTDDSNEFAPLPAARAAAAETWCRVLAASTADPLDGLAPAARLLEETDSAENPGAGNPGGRRPLPLVVQAELIRSLAEYAPPARIPSLADALDPFRAAGEAPVELRRAAIEACLIHAAARTRSTGEALATGDTPRIWPTSLANCRLDRDAGVRRLYGRWMAVTKHPEAFPTLQAQLSDHEVSVRDAALESLGILGTPEAIAELERQAGRSEELIRAAAVKGLSRLGPDRLTRHARDESGAVRRGVALGLGRHPEPRSALLLRELLADANLQVQSAALEALADWPDRLAIPLLLHSMEESSTRIRQQSFDALRRRCSVDEPYRADAPAEERRASVARLARQLGLSGGLFDELRQAGIARETEVASATRHKDQIDHALRDLASAEVFDRRRGAQKLAECAAAASLDPDTLRKLREALAHEQDWLTWRFAMESIFPDASDDAAAIALLAINHVWPDIRLLGCEYYRRHPHPEAAHGLRPLLDDGDRNVRRAAIDAAGRCGNAAVIDDYHPPAAKSPVRGLRSLLRDGDRQTRFAAAVALSRLGNEEGLAELSRLAHDDSPAARIEAVRAMAETGRTRFRRPLVALGWTERNERVRRAILEALNELTPPADRPDELAQARDDAARMEAWAQHMLAPSTQHGQKN